MDKEKVITILIGLVVGASLASAYFFGSKLIPKLPGKNIQSLVTPQTSVTPTPQAQTTQLTLTSPDDNSSTTKSSVTVAAVTQPQIPVIVYANADEKIASSDASGKFQTQVKLEEGENEISVTVFDSQGKPNTIRRNVTMEITP